MKIAKLILSALLPLAIAGCTGTNPKAAFNDVDQSVMARTGDSVQWWRGQSASNEIAEAIAPLLKTNLTAQTAVAVALLNNRSLQAEFEKIGISQADLAQASRLHNLEIAGSWRFPDRPPSAVDAEYSAAGDLLDLLTLPARKKVAVRNLEQTKLQVADKVLELAAETQTAFYDLQAQLDLTNRLATLMALNDAAADFARRQYNAGDINELDLNNQQASAAQSHLEFMQARARAQLQRERLNRLMGLADATTDWHIADELPALPVHEPPLENLETLAVKQRLDLAAAREQVESMAAALRLKKHTRFIPGAAIGVDTERTPDGQRVTGPTLDLELPLFDQGQPAVARLAAEYRQARDNYEALEVDVRSEVRQAKDAWLAARAAAEFSGEHLVPLQAKILRQTLLQYDAMQESTYDLLLARQNEETAMQEQVTSLRDYWIARAEVERAVGGRLGLANESAPASNEAKSVSQSH